MEALRQITERSAFAKSFKQIRLTNGITDTDRKPWRMQVTRGQLRAVRVEQEKIQRAENEFRAGQATSCLVAIFFNLKKAGNIPDIQCTSNEMAWGRARDYPYGPHPVGYNSLRRRLGYDHCLSTLECDGTAYATLQNALAQSGIPIKHLAIGGCSPAAGLSHFNVTGIPAAYHRLRRLSLQLAPEEEYTDDAKDDVRRAADLRSFISALQSAQEIEHLKLLVVNDTRYVRDSHSATFEAIAKARAKGLILPRLGQLELGKPTIKLGVLLEFITSLRSTLYSLELKNLSDGAMAYPDLSKRIYDALSVPEPAYCRAFHSEDPHRIHEERRMHDHDPPRSLYLEIIHCYPSPRGYTLQDPDLMWPRPWPEIDI